MILIGIDPGSAGGIASYDSIKKEVSAVKMPGTDTEIYNCLLNISPDIPIHDKDEVYVLCEKVGGFIGFRKKEINILCPNCRNLIPYTKEEGDPGSTMFKFGDGNGFIRGICVALGYGYDTMAPKSWQKIHNLFKPQGMPKTQWKNIIKDRAQKLYPKIKVTLNTADALLILDVLMRIKLRQF
jgi:hypothetical protein